MKEKERASAYDCNPELIERFLGGDEEAGERLVELNSPLVYSIASRFRERTNDISELVECGTVGLVKAFRSFDKGRGCAFSTYAVPLIFGEIRRFLRDDGMIKVSREQKRRCAELNRERQRRLSLGEPTDIRSLSEALGITAEDAADAIFAEAQVRSLDEGVGDEEGGTLGSMLKDESSEGEFERIALRLAIDRLTEEQRRLILLRYYRDKSQSECARILGLSQVKVSREEKKIIGILRRELGAKGGAS